MKKYFTLLLIVFCLVTAHAAVKDYTPSDVPNVQKQDRNRFVSDPSEVMSPTARAAADAKLRALTDSTTAEIAVVILPGIGNADIFEFAQTLARDWGIGKADKDNGMLVLFDMDGRQVRMHVGQGLEGIFTDVACRRIIDEVVVPPMRNGDVDAAVLGLADKVSSVLTDPVAAQEIRSSAGNAMPFQGVNFWYFLLIPLIATVWVYGDLIKLLLSLRGKPEYEKARELHAGHSSVMSVVLCILTLGLGVPAIFIRRAARHYYRNKPRKCDCCGTKMNKLSEEEDNKYLTKGQDMEERLNSVDYDVWLCPNCGTSEIFPFHNHSTTYERCPNCGTHALHLLYDRVERPASTTRRGVGVKVYECKNCGKRYERRYDIPLETVAPVIIGGIGGRGGGGGSIGGGFGGGSFGGGGSTGSW